MGRTILRAARHGALALLTALCVCACGSPDDGEAPVVTSPPAAETPSIYDPPAPAHEGYTLREAADRGLVEYEVVGTGGSSGDALLLEIRNTGTESVVVYVEPGTVFGTDSPGVQSMVAYGVRGHVINLETGAYEPMDTIRLYDAAPQHYALEAYCLDFELNNPSPMDTFVAAAAVDVRAATVLHAAKASALSVSATQAAIWMDRDHVTKEEVAAKFEASDQELEDAWQLLKRLPPP